MSRMKTTLRLLSNSFIILLQVFLFIGISTSIALAQMPDAPERAEGEGPFERLIIRGVNLIDGTGSPMMGPVDIVISGNRIISIQTVGYPGVPVNERRRPQAGPDDYVLDATGMFALPGFFDNHAHTGGGAQGTTPEYVYKLWLAHGITSIREPGSFNGLDWTLRHKTLSENNQITAPRIFAYVGFGSGFGRAMLTGADAREWVQSIHARGADGIKFFGATPEVYSAALDEASKLGLGSMTHHAQTRVVYANALQSARWGLRSLTHWYGLPEALFTDRIVQHYPLDYNYQDEQQSQMLQRWFGKLDGQTLGLGLVALLGVLTGVLALLLFKPWRRETDVQQRLFRRFERLLARHGARRHKGEGARSFAQRAAAMLPEQAPAILAFVSLYEAQRYAQQTDATDDLSRALSQLRRALPWRPAAPAQRG